MTSIIYKLYCKDKNITDCYIGSTTNYANRKRTHKSSCNNIKSRNYKQKKYIYIRENGGYENWDYEILETINLNDKIKERELFWIDKTWDNNLNTERPWVSKNDEKIRYKEWSKNNPEKLKKKAIKWRKNNPEKYKKINNKFTGVYIFCNLCGLKSSKNHIKRHQKTKRCMKIQESIKK